MKEEISKDKCELALPSTMNATSKNASGTGFLPVNPWKHPKLEIQSRHLPHLRTFGATYFVTFRCAKGIELPEPARDLALSSVTYWDDKKIDLDAAVIMPDHIHMIFRLSEQNNRQEARPTLSSILHSIKSFSAKRINKLLKREGSVWLDESFDHIIRNRDDWEDYKWLWVKRDRQDACPT